MKEIQQYTMKYPVKLLKEIDAIKNNLGYTSRNNTIIYLLNRAIEDIKKGKDNHEKT